MAQSPPPAQPTGNSAKKRSRRVSFFLVAYSNSEKLDCIAGSLVKLHQPSLSQVYAAAGAATGE